MTDSQGHFVDILKNKPLGSGASQQREKPEGQGGTQTLKFPYRVFSTNDTRKHRAMGLFVNVAAARGFTL